MKLFFWGGSSMARLTKPIIQAHGHAVEVVFDAAPDVNKIFSCPYIHDEGEIREHAERCEGFLVAIGGNGWNGGIERQRCGRILEAEGLAPVSAIHPKAYLAESVIQGKGLIALVGATVSEDARLGDDVILNTNCTVDHDAVVGNGAHVMGGANLASSVVVGEFARIGTGATVLPGIKIGNNAYVGAGAVVTKDVEDNAVVAGVPARFVRHTK